MQDQSIIDYGTMTLDNVTNQQKSVSFISWNVKGLNNLVKRSKVFSHLKSLKPDVMFLQETHLNTNSQKRLGCKWIGQIYHSRFNYKTRGTAILIRKGVPFEHSEVISDPNGRYVVVVGKLFNTPLILANIYGPNWDNAQFFLNFFSTLPDLVSYKLILGGDFNCVLSPQLDRSSVRSSNTLSSAAVAINSLLRSYGLSDPWRATNPTTKQFSFFSPVHHSYSRIDYFIVDNQLLPLISSTKYHSIVLSDHSPVQMGLVFPGNVAPQRTWRLDPLLLLCERFKTFLSNQIDFFLEINDTQDVSRGVLWESMKAYIRGQVISYVAHRDKERSKQLKELADKIADMDRRYALSPTPDLFKEKLLLQTEFDTLMTWRAERNIFKSRQVYYEHGDKAGRLLALQLKQRSAERVISGIEIGADSISHDPRVINDQFKYFYSTLYQSEVGSNSSEIYSFLDSLDLPKLSPDAQSPLEQPLSIEEITNAIKLSQTGRAPGPDGFPMEFYKEFSSKLTPILESVYAESFATGNLPQTLTQATISVLLKKDKDPVQCSSYRPISLLCCDYKILTKTLALRLDPVISTIINEDQTGFIPGRQSFFNVRRLFNVVFSPHSTIQPEVILSLDAEKAFDRIEWSYLFTVLEKFGMGPTFCRWIKVLYSTPMAAVRTNGLISEYFSLYRGTRQGCCLSPFLFDIAIEPLAIAIRSDERIKGISRGEVTHKTLLYADDLLLQISDPIGSMPHLFRWLREFSNISGYKVNLSKSLLFPLNNLAKQTTYDDLPFKIENDKFTYLGLEIAGSIKTIFQYNYRSILDSTKSDLDRWSKLPLSLAGRINVVKMTVMPRFLYLFQMIPIFLPKSYFAQLDRFVSLFIWNKKPARIRRASLERAKADGGLGLPNFLFYYWAANIVKLTYWITMFADGEGPVWADMELRATLPISPISILTAPLPLNVKASGLNSNLVVQNSIKIWGQFRKHFNLTNTCGFSPIMFNHLFTPSQIDHSFAIWHRNGLVFFQDLFTEDGFVSFKYLCEDHNLPKSHYFRYLQARSFASKFLPGYPSLPSKDLLYLVLNVSQPTKRAISKIYALILESCPHTWDKPKAAWEGEVGELMSEDIWKKAIQRIHTSSLCIRHGLIQFKVVHRLHYSNDRLSKLYPDVAPNCPRCDYSPVSLGHMFWSCPSLYGFWASIFQSLSAISGETLRPDSLIAIFGVPREELRLSPLHKNAIAFASLHARRLILLSWKASNPPSYVHWIREVMLGLALEKIRYTVRGLESKYDKTWSRFITHVKSLSFA